jgi:RimJ/RimL family protein N-acetyltransferase
MADVTMTVVLRPAVIEDAAMLLAWANDPVTRAASRRHDPIAAAGHRRWLERRLATPNDNRIWIGESAGVPIGVVRFERREPDAIEVSITVAPEARGRGLGRPLLEAGVAAAREAFGPVTIVADILPGNEASRRLFTGAGFERVIPEQSDRYGPQASDDALTYRLRSNDP